MFNELRMMPVYCLPTWFADLKYKKYVYNAKWYSIMFNLAVCLGQSSQAVVWESKFNAVYDTSTCFQILRAGSEVMYTVAAWNASVSDTSIVMSLILLSSVLKINMLSLYHGKPYIKMPMWHYIMKALYKSYPVEYTYILVFLCIATTWPLHDCHMTAMWPPHDCHMTAIWPPHDCHMTATWPPMTATWLPCDRHTTAMWPPHDCHVTATWLPYDCHMTAT